MFPKLLKKQQTIIATSMIEKAESIDFIEFIEYEGSYEDMVAFFKAHPDDSDYDTFEALHSDYKAKKANVKKVNSVDSLTEKMDKMDIEGGFTLYDMTKAMELPEIGLVGVSSKQLKELFGKPEESDDPEEDGFRFIYTVKLKGKVYEIYDRQDEENEWDPIDKIEWYASSKGRMAALRQAFGVRIPYSADDFNVLETNDNITTEMLTSKGEMIRNPEKDEEWSRGFYFEVGKKVYFVHDLADCDGVFDPEDDEWYVKGTGAIATLVKFLKA
jgi:hypothetical protein